MTTTKKDSEGVNTKKDQHEKRTGSGQHKKRSGSGQHEKETGRGQHEKRSGSGQHEKRTGSGPWPLTLTRKQIPLTTGAPSPRAEMHMKIYISPSREYYPAPTIPLAEMQPKFCIPATGGLLLGSLRITNINRNMNTNVKNLFKISAARLVLNRFFYVCVYVSIYVRNSQSPYYFSSCPRLRKCTESCAFPRAEMRSGCCISASRKCKRMCAVPQAVLHIKRSKK